MSAVVERKPAVTSERLALAARVAEMRAAGMLYREIAGELGISRSYASALVTDPDGSEQLARRARYQGTCERCGAATDGSNGRASAPQHCSTCSQAIQQENGHWTRETVIAAIRRWNDEHGAPPTAAEWMSPDRPEWAPTINGVARYGGWKNAPFATWCDAVEAAGFPRPLSGVSPGQTAWTRELVIEQLQATAIGGYAMSSDTLPYRNAAARHFGSWAAACAAAGLRPASERRAREPEAMPATRETGR